jgi:hypothetical protein
MHTLSASTITGVLWASVGLSIFGVLFNGAYLWRAVWFWLRCSPPLRAYPMHAKRIRFGSIVTGWAVSCLAAAITLLCLSPSLGSHAGRSLLLLGGLLLWCLPFAGGSFVRMPRWPTEPWRPPEWSVGD